MCAAFPVQTRVPIDMHARVRAHPLSCYNLLEAGVVNKYLWNG